jgi:hypothetical protein
MSDYDRKYYQEHREKKLRKTREWRERNKEYVKQKKHEEYVKALAANPDLNKQRYQRERAARLEYARRNQDRILSRRRLRDSGHTPEYYRLQLISQQNLCPICTVELDRSAHADHDHSTNKPRGVLCARCNKGLGHFGDDVVRLKAAITYLESWV